MKTTSNKTNQIENTKKRNGFFSKIRGLFRSQSTVPSSQKEAFSLLDQHWNTIQPLLFKLKLTKTDLDKESFWQKLDLNWAKDVNDQGYLQNEQFENIIPDYQKVAKIVQHLQSKTLISLISKQLNNHWDNIYPLLYDVRYFASLSDFTFWKSINLNWKEDLTSSGVLSSTVQAEIINAKDSVRFSAIWKLDKAFLSEIIYQQVEKHWKAIEVDFASVAKQFIAQKVSLWSFLKLNPDQFTKNYQLKKEFILKTINEDTFDPQVFKSIDLNLLHKVTLQLLLNNWKKNILPLFYKIRKLKLSFDLNERWRDAGLKLISDFDDNGWFSRQGLDKIKGYSIADLLKIIEFLNYDFFTQFLCTQILDYWKELRPYLVKASVVKSRFFYDQLWTKLDLDPKKSFDKDFFFLQSVIDELSQWKLTRLQSIFAINLKVLSEFIVKSVDLSWRNKRLILIRIFIFDKTKLLASPEWKATGLRIGTELQDDFSFYPSFLQGVATAPVDQLLGITKLTVTFLTKLFFTLLDDHWKTLAPVLETVKKKKLDFSGQDFWLLTNLNWNTDLQKNGYLTDIARDSVFNKTIDQILAIKRLDGNKIRLSLDFTLQRMSQKTEKVSSPQSLSFWQSLKVFFGFGVTTHRTLQERLESKLNLKLFELQDNISLYKNYRKRIGILKKLRQKYSKTLIQHQDIIATGEANIQPNRFVIEVEGVSKYFLTQRKVNQIISKITLKIRRGDFVVILGPSGAGKSTFLNLISGISNPDGGDLFVNGINLTLLNDGGLTEFRRRYVSFVFQQYNLLQNLTARENIDIVSALLPKNKEPFNMKELLKLLEIESLADKYPFELSGGEQQRFAIARALSKNPEILFCDEPTGALDQEMSRKVMQLLFEINNRYRTTIVLVTHNRLFAQIAKTVVHFVNGKVVKFVENAEQVEPKNISFHY